MSNVVINPFVFAGGFSSPLDHGAALLFWWDAEQGITLGTSPDIDTWTDQDTGIDADFEANKPHLLSSELNGLAGVSYDDTGVQSSARLVAGATSAIDNIWTKGTETTLWCVFKINSIKDGYLWDKGWNGGADGWAFMQRVGGEFFWRQRGSGTDVQVNTSNTFSTGAHYIKLVWDGDMTTLPVLEVDGASESFGGSGQTGTPEDDSGSPFYIGDSQPGGGQSIGGSLHEFYVTVDSSIDPSEDETYLTDKWGL